MTRLIPIMLALCACTGPAADTADTGARFVFEDAPPSAYARIDRVGMPAVNTAVITSKDAYNRADPVDDADGEFVDEITTNVGAFHDALDDDLQGLGLTPCATADCVAQAAPLVVPDTLGLDLSRPPGFPNGRLPSDPVVDVTLAVVLLDLSVDGQAATTLAEVPVNPPENDVPFLEEFPWLAPLHF